MTQLRLEFLVEPFVAGAPGPHVDAALVAATSAGLAVEAGPFANEASGSVAEVAGAVAALLAEAFAHGATRVSVVAASPGEPTIGAVGQEAPSPSVSAPSDGATEFLEAVAPIVEALGAAILTPETTEPGVGDLELRWRGQAVGIVRPTPLTEALGHLIAQVERDLGGPLASLDRATKQRAVALLHERGAFAVRRATDAVAEAMGVSRITIYNYLNALETEA